MFFFFFSSYSAWLVDAKVPANHTELGFWIVSPRCASIQEPDGHVLGSVAVLWGSGTGVPSKVSSCSMGKRQMPLITEGTEQGLCGSTIVVLGPTQN